MAATGTKRVIEGSGDTQEVFKKKKKCRVDNCFSDMGHIHTVITRNLLEDVTLGMRSIVYQDCSTFIKINRLTVLNSNAIDGSSFSEAFCRISENNDEYSFASLFQKGLHILMKYLRNKEMPSNDQESQVLETLLHYLIKMENDDAETHFQILEGLGETDITIILTNHLFGKLSTSSHFLIDKQCKGKGKAKESCPCPNAGCKITGCFGDTGIGNPSVWHGNLDVIVNNQVVVETLEDEPDCDNPGRTPMEVKVKSVCLSRNPQIIAETIVFSFLQKKRHPEYTQFLFPCIGVNSKEMVVYFYDSENDVLLESSPIPLHSFTGNVSLVAVVVSWLVVNHKYLCDGLTEVMKKERSGFFCQAEEALPIYENELQFGDVGISCPKPKPQFNFVTDPSTKQLEKDWREIIRDQYSSNT